jgi:hypothetical protein
MGRSSREMHKIETSSNCNLYRLHMMREEKDILDFTITAYRDFFFFFFFLVVKTKGFQLLGKN